MDSTPTSGGVQNSGMGRTMASRKRVEGSVSMRLGRLVLGGTAGPRDAGEAAPTFEVRGRRLDMEQSS